MQIKIFDRHSKSCFLKNLKHFLKKIIIIAWNKILKLSIKIFASEIIGAMVTCWYFAPALPWGDLVTRSTHHSTYGRSEVWIWGWVAPGCRDPGSRSRSRRFWKRPVRSSPQLRISTFCWRFSQLRGRLCLPFLRICRIAIAMWKSLKKILKFTCDRMSECRTDCSYVFMPKILRAQWNISNRFLM